MLLKAHTDDANTISLLRLFDASIHRLEKQKARQLTWLNRFINFIWCLQVLELQKAEKSDAM